MLKRIRVVLAMLFFMGVLLVFLDFTGVASSYLGWMTKAQFLPAVLAGNFIVLAVLVVMTLVYGRLYCSIICPLGVMQDGFAALGRKSKRNRYSYSRPLNVLRYVMLAVMIVALILGVGTVFALLAPYSAFGRIASNLLQPVWMWGNNLLASWAESHNSYAFYHVDIWLKSLSSLIIAALTLIILGWLAWRSGRTYCNTICPVGTILGLLSRFSWLRPVIDTSKCINCGKCARNCKSACIDVKNHKIDYSRCVTCFDCIGNCSTGAISYTRRRSVPASSVTNKQARCVTNLTGDSMSHVQVGKKTVTQDRRSFLSTTALIGGVALTKAQIKVDGGLAIIQDKKMLVRGTPLVPAGAVSNAHLQEHCTGCQLCVAACPNAVLRPRTTLDSLMQPEMSYERGYCRPECTRCGEVCPAGAIRPVTREEKSSISIGHAVWIKDNCIVITDDHRCGVCARHCPAGAITMVALNREDKESLRIPSVDTEKCIGCGACENLCPARPFSAIYVEGNHRHREV